MYTCTVTNMVDVERCNIVIHVDIYYIQPVIDTRISNVMYNQLIVYLSVLASVCFAYLITLSRPTHHTLVQMKRWAASMVWSNLFRERSLRSWMLGSVWTRAWPTRQTPSLYSMLRGHHGVRAFIVCLYICMCLESKCIVYVYSILHGPLCYSCGTFLNLIRIFQFNP